MSLTLILHCTCRHVKTKDWIKSYSIHTYNSKCTLHQECKGGTQKLSYSFTLLYFLLLGLPTCVSSSSGAGNLLQVLIPVLQLHTVTKSGKRCICTYQTTRGVGIWCSLLYIILHTCNGIVVLSCTYSRISSSTAEQQLLNLTWEIRNCSWCCLSISTSCN